MVFGNKCNVGDEQLDKMGNGTETNYDYDERCLHLNQMSLTSNGVKMMECVYKYDNVDNILGISNAVSRAGGKIFSYDADGNPVSVEDTTANTLRVMQWDEEGRLQSLGDDGYVSRYTYNHAGERVVKSHGRTTVAFVNGAPQGVLWHDRDNWTMYVSPYMVVSPDRFMKHYYAGSQRIASKIGTGSFNNLYDASKACVTAGQKDYAERLNQITQSRNDYYAALGIPPVPPTAKGVYGEAEYRGEYGDYMTTPLGNYDAPEGWPVKPYKRPYGGTPGPPVMYEKPSNPEDEGAGYGFKIAGTKEKDVYFYHSDHLGSTSYITDRDGNATQFVCYKPYGEALVDEHATSFETPWKFNGKELDSETGLYYYGARYYEPTLAVWYGVDALAEKYPSMGGYVYCAGNPVRYVDPDGNSWYITINEDGCNRSKWFNNESVYFQDENNVSWYNVGEYYKTGDYISINEVIDEHGYTLSIYSHGSNHTYSGMYSVDANGLNSQSISTTTGSFTGYNSLEKASSLWNVPNAYASALCNYSYNSTIGSNGRLYFAKGHGFYGNQYVKTTKLAMLGSSMAKITGHIGCGISVAQVGYGMYQDGNFWGPHTVKELCGAVGGIGGAWAGAKLGGAIGTFAGPRGMIIGAFVGGAIGGYYGGKLGAFASGYLYNQNKK